MGVNKGCGQKVWGTVGRYQLKGLENGHGGRGKWVCQIV